MQFIRELESLNPFRTHPGKLPLSYVLRNMVFDTIFYDVSALKPGEHAEILRQVNDFDEGGMLVVWPTAEDRRIAYYGTSDALVRDHPDIDAIAIAGVGSSPLGTAALARQVADVHGREVVGVIAGYGAADVVSEALGGWLDFGGRNRARTLFSSMRGATGAQPISSEEARAAYQVVSDYLLVDEPESNTLVNLLLRQGDKLRLLVGHSKGALNIQNAAYGFDVDHRADGINLDRLRVVTFGCGITLPKRFPHLEQFVGTQDALGRFNTPSSVTRADGFHWVAGKAHNLNEKNPLHTPLDDLLEEAIAGIPPGGGPTLVGSERAASA